MSFIRSALIQYLLLGTTLIGCGFNDGFTSSEYKGVITRAPSGGALAVDYPYEIHSKNALHIAGYPSIFFEQLVDSEQVTQVVSWDHWLNNNEQCDEALSGEGIYEVDCGDRIGELTVFLTYANTLGQKNTLFIRTMISVDESAQEADVFPEGR